MAPEKNDSVDLVNHSIESCRPPQQRLVLSSRVGEIFLGQPVFIDPPYFSNSYNLIRAAYFTQQKDLNLLI